MLLPPPAPAFLHTCTHVRSSPSSNIVQVLHALMEHCPKSNVKPDIKFDAKFDVKFDAKCDAKSYASSPAMLGPKVRGRESEIDSHIRAASSDEVDSSTRSRECSNVGRWSSTSMGTVAAICMRAHAHIFCASTLYSLLATCAVSAFSRRCTGS